MGPLELQLYRELAIQIVRECSRVLQVDQGTDSAWYRHWFKRYYDTWAATPRLELGGLTPAEAIDNERAAMRADNFLPATLHPSRVELYTDLPQAEDASDRIELDADTAGPILADLEDDGVQQTADLIEPGLPPFSPADEARWRAFCDRFLRDWLDDA